MFLKQTKAMSQWNVKLSGLGALGTGGMLTEVTLKERDHVYKT